MFGNKKESSNALASTGSSNAAGGTNSLVQGTTIEGVLNAGSDIRIDGHLNGKLICAGRLILGD